MALSAKLYFGSNADNQHEKEYELADCRFVFGRPHNEFRPESYARCDRIEVVMPVPRERDLTLFQWYYLLESKEGWLEVIMTGNGQSTDNEKQVIHFWGAKCISLSEHYDIDAMKQRQIKICFTAETLKFNDINFTLDRL